MLPQQLVLLVALALGSPWSSPVAAAPTSPLLAQPPSFALPVLGSGRLTGSDGDAGGQRIALSAHTLSQVAFGRGSSPGSSGVVTGQSGLRRRASSSNSDPVDDDAVWEALGWVQKGGTYSVPVEIGSPPHTFYLQIDTASADLLLASTLCLSSASCKALLASRLPAAVLQDFTSPSTPYVELYNPDRSETFSPVNANGTHFESRFADGTVASGFAARERVAWGGVVGPQAGRLTIDDQVVGLLNSTNLTLADQHIAGVFGLGPPRLSAFSRFSDESNGRGEPLLSRLAHNASLSYPLFGLHLLQNTTLGGSLTLGAIDGEIVTDQSLIEWHPVVKFPPFKDTPRHNATSPFLQWAVELTNVTVNGTAPVRLFSAAYPETRNATYALIDSGASGIFGPIEDVEYLFSLIDGSRMVSDGVWIVPCKTRATMTFSFGGRDYVLQPGEWLIGRVSTNTQECLAWPVALPPSGDGIGWQLGTPFLRSVYSVFHMGIDTVQEPLVGFLPLSNATSLVETAANVSSLLDAAPFFTTVLPNVLLPTPTFATPVYLFNTSAWYATATSDGITQTSTHLPTRTVGLGSPTGYTALPLGQGSRVATLPAGFSGQPIVRPANASVIHELQSARESIASVASVTWGAGLAISGAATVLRLDIRVAAACIASGAIAALCITI